MASLGLHWKQPLALMGPAAVAATLMGCGAQGATTREGASDVTPDDAAHKDGPGDGFGNSDGDQTVTPEQPIAEPRDLPTSDCGTGCETMLVGVGTGVGFDLGNPQEHVATDPLDGALIVDTALDVSSAFMWVADTGLPGAVKIDLVTMAIVGHYYTGGGSTSRTTINSLGEAFVASRSGGPNGDHGVTKILPGGDDCPDTNGDGVITTSHGEGDLLPYGQDDCVIWHTELEGDARGMAAQDISGLSGDVCAGFDPNQEFTDEPPPPAADEHYVWVGGLHGKIYKLDAATGEILVKTTSPQPVYGGALDAQGRFWIGKTLSYLDTLKCTDSATCDAEPICNNANDWDGFDNCLDSGAVKARKLGTSGYGITVDCKQRVWMSATTQRYDPSLPVGARHATAAGVASSGLGGIAVDSKGWVWASNGTRTTRVDSDTLDGVQVDAPNKGVAVTPDGRVITVRTRGLHVIEPGPTLNDALVQKDAITLPGTAYAYSDMTGVQTRLATDEPGSYRQVFEGCSEQERTEWQELLFDTDIPDDTWVRFQVRAADSREELEGQPFQTIACNGPSTSGPGSGPLGAFNGDLLEVRVQLSASTRKSDTQKGCGATSATSARVRNFGPVVRCVGPPAAPDEPEPPHE